MLKWLIITFIVLSGLMVILLGLGYLLAENEKSSTLLKNQLALEAQLQQEKLQQKRNLSEYTKIITTDDVKATPKQTNANIMALFEDTLINNLTCVTIAQCKLVTIKFKNIDCQLASNVIGVSQLKKIATQKVSLDSCPMANQLSELACQQNICTLISANK